LSKAASLAVKHLQWSAALPLLSRLAEIVSKRLDAQIQNGREALIGVTVSASAVEGVAASTATGMRLIHWIF
jgi:hypothetical protein